MAHSATLPVITAENGLSRYLEEIRRFPMLEPQEEYMLAKRWREHDDRPAAHKLVTSHLRLVAKISILAELEAGTQVIFPPGAGTVAVAVKADSSGENVEFFSGNPLAKKADTKFEIETGVPQHYCLSANGDMMARLTLVMNRAPAAISRIARVIRSKLYVWVSPSTT